MASVAAYAADLLGDRDALAPFLKGLTDALGSLRGPPAPPEPVVGQDGAGGHQATPAPVVPPTPTPAYRAPEPPLVLPPSAWDPEPAEVIMEASRARALLLELIRRAAHDWVLYRTSRRMDKRELAKNAFVWLFEEEPGHPWAIVRQKEGRHLTGFLSICNLLDLDPSYVRNRVKQMTAKGIKMAGRPAEHRRRHGGQETDYYVEHSVDHVSLEELDNYN